MIKRKRCVVCNAVIRNKRRTAKYCSEACKVSFRMAVRRARKEQEQAEKVVCEQCGKSIKNPRKTKAGWQRFCRPQCCSIFLNAKRKSQPRASEPKKNIELVRGAKQNHYEEDSVNFNDLQHNPWG